MRTHWLDIWVGWLCNWLTILQTLKFYFRTWGKPEEYRIDPESISTSVSLAHLSSTHMSQLTIRRPTMKIHNYKLLSISWHLLRKWGLFLSPGASFSKVPKLFGRNSGDIILFVSSKLRRFEARNFAVIFIFILFIIYEKTSFTELAGRSFTNGFSGPKSFRDFRETGAFLIASINSNIRSVMSWKKLHHNYEIQKICHKKHLLLAQARKNFQRLEMLKRTDTPNLDNNRSYK